MPKICYIIGAHPSLSPGGAEVDIHNVAVELKKRGWDIEFVTIGAGDKKTEKIDGFTVRYAYTQGQGLPIIRFISHSLGFLKAFEESDADIYHQTCLGIATGLAGYFCSRNKKKLVVTTENITDSKLELPLFTRLFAEYGLNKADAITALANYMRIELEKRINRKVLVIHNSAVLPPKAPKPKDFVVLWAARMVPHKHPELFLKLAESLKDTKFIMCGKGPLLEKIQREAGENVSVLGHVDFAKMNEQYKKASVFVSTSEYEGFPVTYLEAWSNSTPVIGFWDPDNAITNHKLGYKAETIEEITDKIRTLRNNKALAEELGKNARAYVEKEHDVKKTALEYEKLYKKLLGG